MYQFISYYIVKDILIYIYIVLYHMQQQLVEQKNKKKTEDLEKDAVSPYPERSTESNIQTSTM